MHTVALRSLLRPESLGTALQFIASWKDLRRFADRAHPSLEMHALRQVAVVGSCPSTISV